MASASMYVWVPTGELGGRWVDAPSAYGPCGTGDQIHALTGGVYGPIAFLLMEANADCSQAARSQKPSSF